MSNFINEIIFSYYSVMCYIKKPPLLDIVIKKLDLI